MMGKKDERIARRLEAQIEAAQRHLAGEDKATPSWVGFVGGLALGTLAGGLLTLFFTSREDEDALLSPSTGDDAIVLREPTSAPRSLAAVRPETGAAEQEGDLLAAAELEDPEALPEIAEQAETTAASDTAAERTVSPAAPAAPAAPTEAASSPVVPAAPAAETASPEAPAAPSAGRVEAQDGACPASHPIKGNHSSSGDFIYHSPGSRNYERTKAEACFATEDDAVAAGFRAPRG